MPRLMVLDRYEDALIATYDFEGVMDTERFEQYVRSVLHHRGRIKERQYNPSQRTAWPYHP